MLPLFADPKTGFVFRRIFNAEAHSNLLLAWLNHLLELEGEQRFVAVDLLPPEQRVAVPEMRLSIVDLSCTNASGHRVVVEIQVLLIEEFQRPVIDNAREARVMLRRDAERYPPLGDVVGVTICNFILWPAKDASGGFEIPMLSRWRMREEHARAKGLPQVQYAFLELPKYTAGDAPQTMIDKWTYFFRVTRDLDVVPEALAEQPFREALDVARSASFNEFEWLTYERAKMAEQDARGALALARREGFEQGLAGVRAERPRNWRRETLLRLLGHVGITLSEAERTRVEACVEATTLDRWLDNLVGAKTAADVLT